MRTIQFNRVGMYIYTDEDKAKVALRRQLCDFSCCYPRRIITTNVNGCKWAMIDNATGIVVRETNDTARVRSWIRKQLDYIIRENEVRAYAKCELEF